MHIFSDLHLHSKYSRACSKDIEIETLVQGAKWKGLQLLGTGDFTHPRWLKEIENKLIELKEESGFYILPQDPSVFFVLSVEVNFVFYRQEKARRVHFVVLTSNLKTAKQINEFLSFYGNLEADGRPTINLDPKIFLKKALEIDPQIIMIPAHIWTPWFGILGSYSGFNSLEECFEEMTEKILAIETGLSSDPLMNWQVDFLDKVSIVSFSDSHSTLPHRLGREATVFNLENLSFQSLYEAIKNEKIEFTIEFFPEEGKYHYDGHRACSISFSPEEAEKIKNICPLCQKPLTIGVLHRVKNLATRKVSERPAKRPPYFSLVPLAEIIAKVLNSTEWSKKVQEVYFSLIDYFNNEYNVLLSAPIEKIKEVTFENIGKAIEKMRQQKLKLIPGYDGVYGRIEFDFEEETKKSPTLF